MTQLCESYKEKCDAYYSDPREDLAALVEGVELAILDVGCGSGATGKRLLDLGKARWVSGVEVISSRAELAWRVLNAVITGDLAQIEFSWAPGGFDYIIAGDVLEHLVDPWNVLRRLKPMLRPGGSLIVSLPNVRHWSVLSDLIFRGEWRYRQDGVLDETHLRFFTRRSALRMMRETGFKIESVYPYFWGPKTTAASRLALGLVNEFLAQRYLIVARD
jgi:2-polyprenyl-3-methyl-5-hydroxy-6-metoxy-1,4-benzoquinol methylase